MTDNYFKCKENYHYLHKTRAILYIVPEALYNVYVTVDFLLSDNSTEDGLAIISSFCTLKSDILSS